MKTRGYVPAQAPLSTRNTLHRALTTTAEYTEGDILLLTETYNPLTGVVVFSSWKNADTLVAIVTAPTDADVDALDTARVQVGSEVLAITSAAGGTALAAIPANANVAEIHFWATDTLDTLVYNYDGTAPDETISDGYRENDGATFELEGADEIAGFLAKTVLANGSLKVTYSKQYVFNA